MRRVVITGSGIVSCIGNNKKEVLDFINSFYDKSDIEDIRKNLDI